MECLPRLFRQAWNTSHNARSAALLSAQQFTSPLQVQSDSSSSSGGPMSNRFKISLKAVSPAVIQITITMLTTLVPSSHTTQPPQERVLQTCSLKMRCGQTGVQQKRTEPQSRRLAAPANLLIHATRTATDGQSSTLFAASRCACWLLTLP